MLKKARLSSSLITDILDYVRKECDISRSSEYIYLLIFLRYYRLKEGLEKSLMGYNRVSVGLWNSLDEFRWVNDELKMS